MDAWLFDANHWVATESGLCPVQGQAVSAPAVEVQVRSGHRLVADANIQIVVARGGRLCVTTLRQLRQGDLPAIRYGGSWPTTSPVVTDFRPAAAYGNQKRIDIPSHMSGQLALFLGAYVSEGHTSRSNWTVVITNSVLEVLECLRDAVEAVFGVKPRIVRPTERCPYIAVSSKRLVEFLEYLRCGARAQDKRIPRWILQSSWPHVRAFMRGLFLDAFTAWMGRTPKWGLSVASMGLLDDVQVVLTNLGIVHGRGQRLNAMTGRDYGEVYAVGEQAQQLLRHVEFLEPEKKWRAEKRLAAKPAQSTADVVPIVEPMDLHALIPRGSRGQRSKSRFSFLRDPRTKSVSRRTVERLGEIPGMVMPAQLEWVINEGIHFSPLRGIAPRTEAALCLYRPQESVDSVGGFVLASGDARLVV